MRRVPGSCRLFGRGDQPWPSPYCLVFYGNGPSEPIGYLRAGHTLKVADVVRDHREPPTERDGSNLQVWKPDRDLLPLYLRGDRPVDFCRLPVKGEHATHLLYGIPELLDEERRVWTLVRPLQHFRHSDGRGVDRPRGCSELP